MHLFFSCPRGGDSGNFPVFIDRTIIFSLLNNHGCIRVSRRNRGLDMVLVRGSFLPTSRRRNPAWRFIPVYLFPYLAGPRKSPAGISRFSKRNRRGCEAAIRERINGSSTLHS